MRIMLRKVLAGIMASAIAFGSTYSFAYDTGKMSAEYQYIDKVSGIAAEMFIDESLTREDLIGRAWIRIYPFDEMGVINHE